MRTPWRVRAGLLASRCVAGGFRWRPSAQLTPAQPSQLAEWWRQIGLLRDSITLRP
jgi:hypothetical protein